MQENCVSFHEEDRNTMERGKVPFPKPTHTNTNTTKNKTEKKQPSPAPQIVGQGK
jgi:hypothetical protein